MDFDAVLAQVREFLQRQGRVSYRALKLRFNLDDEVLAALKDELIYAQHIAQDEDDRVLVWTEEAGTTPEPAHQPSVPQSPGTVHVEPRPTDAERRQLTVLFCDLVDSTVLASQLDPEDYREVVRAYQAACTVVIERYDGHIAQYLGDGLLVYFGYPQAHEDDAQRAVRAGLGLVEAMGVLNARLTQHHGVRLAVRIGIHTGMVVVGDIGGGSRQEQLALGETPNVAARLLGLAAPDTVIMSEATWRLVQGYFSGHGLGLQTLKGIETPVQLYRALGTSGAESRLDVASPRGLTPLVGREAELALVRARWAQAQDGLGQVVVLSGEAGIGKSRLLQVLHEHIGAEPHVRVEWRCSAYTQQSPLHPVITHLHHLLRWDLEDPPEAKLRMLEETLTAYGFALSEVVPLLAALLSLPLPAHYPPLTLTPQRQRQKTLDTVLALLFAEAARQPVLFVVEDVHWIDPSTLEFLTLLIDQGPVAHLLTVLTCRPEFAVPWGFRAHLTPLTLSRLPQPQVTQMVGRLAGDKTLPVEVVAQIVAKTDGVPLFVEELTKTILESDLLREREAHYELTGPLPPLAIPATLHDALMARLDRLATVKHVAQLGATIGRTFAYALLQAVASLEEATLQQGLRQLVEAELVYQRGVPPQATYTFKHALIQEAAYQSLLRSARQRYHQRIAQVVEAHFPELCETQPEWLAHHYTEAGLSVEAIPYWQQAGQRAHERSAHREAISHVTKGLALLNTLPDSPERTPHELTLQLALGRALMAVKGFATPEVVRAYGRARELCRQVGEGPQLFEALRGLCTFYQERAELPTARELAEQLLRLAQRVPDPALLLWAHNTFGYTVHLMGEFPLARAHLEHSLALYNPQQHRAYGFVFDPGVDSLCTLAHVLQLLGYSDRALTRSQEALTLARELAHPFSLSVALRAAANVHHRRGELPVAQALLAEGLALCREQEFAQETAQGILLHGWGLVIQGRQAEGMAQMRQGLDAVRVAGAESDRLWMLSLLAAACRHAGQVEEGLSLVAEALALVHQIGKHIDASGLYRLKGDLLLQGSGHTLPSKGPSHASEAEACFRQALEVARRQQAKALELRAAMSLSRLWQQQGKQAEARALLAPIYSWFSEGFNTADLQEAKALLAELS